MFGRQSKLEHQGRDEVHVDVASGYRPATVRVRSGVPLRVVFHRHDDDPCTDRVIFSSPRIERRLGDEGVTPIDIPAQPPGEIRYTCGMGRYSGTIRVTRATDARLGWLRHGRGALNSAATVIVVIVAVGLPIVATLALLSLDIWAATAAIAAAAAMSATAALWMFGIPSARHLRDRRGDIAKDDPARRPVASDTSEPIRRIR